MKKNIDTVIQEFNEGKYSDFGILFHLVDQDIAQFISDKIGDDEHAFRKVYALSMEALLEKCSQVGGLNGIDQKNFQQFALEIAQQKREEWQQSHQKKQEKSDFIEQIKLRLQAQLEEKRKYNPRYFVYYWHHFRYYFTGACFMFVVVFFAFVFGFFTFNKVPKIFANKKVLTQEKDQIFGSLPVFSLLPNKHLGFVDIRANTNILDLKLNQVPLLPDQMPVAKILSGDLFAMHSFLRELNFPSLQSSKFQGAKFERIMLSSGDKVFEVDLQQQQFSLYRRGGAENLIEKQDAVKKLSKMVNKVKNQLSPIGFSWDMYGEAESQQIGDIVYMTFPRLIKGKEVYDEFGTKVIMTIQYHQPSEQVIKLENYDLNQYALSNYPLLNQNQVLERVKKIGIWTGAVIEGVSSQASKGTIVYQKYNQYLIPSLIWNSGNRNFLISLVKE